MCSLHWFLADASSEILEQSSGELIIQRNLNQSYEIPAIPHL